MRVYVFSAVPAVYKPLVPVSFVRDPPGVMSCPIPYLTTDDLLRRAIDSARSIYIRKGTSEPRWRAVRNCLTLPENQARRLCEWAGFDPDELVHR
jgi:hypothetical protein